MDHIAYLSQEIGPRPAGTEEEQQAALYITERFGKEAHLSANIEEFDGNSNALITPIICFAVAVFAVILGIALPNIAIVAFILGLAASAVHACEQLDHPILSQAFIKGKSQNVVAKYEPTRTDEDAASRRRKVILVANYDSGRVRVETNPTMARVLRYLKLGALGGMPVAALIVLLRGLAFPTGGAGIFLAVLAVLCILPAAALLVFAIMEHSAHYSEAANNNASGVAVLLEVARRLGNGEVKADVPVQTNLADADALNYSKPSIGDLSSNLVNLNAAPIATYAANEDTQREATKAAFAGQETPAAEDFSSAITSEMPKIGENGEAPVEEAKPIDEIAEQVQHITVEAPAAEESAEAAAAAVAGGAAAVAETASVATAAQAQADEAASSVPDWYRKATQKAREKKNATADEAPESSYRSRFADFPTATQVTDEGQPEEAAPAMQSAAPVEEAAAAVAEETAPAPQQPAQEEKPATAPAEQPVADQAAPQQPAFQPELFPVDATSAMSPVSAGNLDLEALRAAASDEPASAPAAQQPAVQQPAYQQPEPVVTQRPAVPEQASAQRAPQAMYYAQPEDRSDILAERAKVDRVAVTADEFGAAAGSPASMNGQAALDVPQVPSAAGAPNIPQVPMMDIPSPAAPAQEAAPARSLNLNIPVVDIPSIELPGMEAPEPKPITFNELRQNAPLAQDGSSPAAQTARPALDLPSINSADPAAGATVAMPALSSQPQMGFGAFEVEPATTNNNVSLTGSFAAIGSIGAQPVGDELLEGVDPNDIYVEDAEDSIFDEDFTSTGAYAGEGYVDMPKSRFGKFFGRFRKNKQDATSTSEWLGVDENFDARSVGKARGGWDSFRDEEDDWNGGAFSNLRARVTVNANDDAPAADDQQAEYYDEGYADDSAAYAGEAASDAVSNDAFASAYEAALRVSGGSAEDAVAEEMQQIYSFASGDINTEVWFVALGSELADNGGIKAFLAEHANDMRGAIIVNLEGVGAGKLSYLESEGVVQPTKCSPRVKRFIKKAMQASGVQLDAAKVNWKESAASFAAKHRMQAVTIAGMDGEALANYAQAGDVVENIDPAQVDKAADFVVELLKNI